jgi:IclR family acetate operon transcriptional repressor
MEEKKNILQSFHLGQQILDVVSKSEKSPKFNEILHALSMTKSNLSKYLSNLTDIQFLHRNEDGTYALGYKMIEYGMSAINRDDFIQRVEPHVHLITKELEETACISIWTPEGPLVVKMCTSNRQLNITGPVGTLLPFFSSAGKLFAAFGDEREISQWREKAVSTLSETERQSLQEELQDVRQQKIAFAKEPLSPFISTAAIPIHDFKNDLKCVVTVIGLSQTIPTHADEETSKYLLNKRAEISGEFGGR